MPLDFPANPSLNDTYSFGGKTWIWNGEYWRLNNTGAINNIPIGNVTANTGNFTTLEATGFTSTGNIATGNILTDGYFYANGAPFEPGGVPGGSNTSIQFNNDDVFGGSADLTWDGSELYVNGTANVIGNITGGNILGNGAGLSGINVFSNVSISGGNSILADSISDTLTLIAGDGISLIGNTTADSITIALTGSGDSIFVTGGDMGTVEEAVTQEQDLGLITDVATTEIDMGTIVTGGVIYPDQLVIPSYTVAELGNLSATPAAQFVYCSNESGGAVPAFSDGTNWRRVTDRAIVT